MILAANHGYLTRFQGESDIKHPHCGGHFAGFHWGMGKSRFLIIEKTRIPLDLGRAVLCEGYLWKEWCERHPSVAQWGIGEPGEPSANWGWSSGIAAVSSRMDLPFSATSPYVDICRYMMIYVDICYWNVRGTSLKSPDLRLIVVDNVVSQKMGGRSKLTMDFSGLKHLKPSPK